MDIALQSKKALLKIAMDPDMDFDFSLTYWLIRVDVTFIARLMTSD